MKVPISIRLDDDVRDELKAQARIRGVELATLLRDRATHAAQDARRVRIREESKRVAGCVATSEKARSFHEDRGAPSFGLGTGP